MLKQESRTSSSSREVLYLSIISEASFLGKEAQLRSLREQAVHLIYQGLVGAAFLRITSE